MVLFLEAARFGAAISSIKKIVMEKILRKTLKKYDKVKFWTAQVLGIHINKNKTDYLSDVFCI